MDILTNATDDQINWAITNNQITSWSQIFPPSEYPSPADLFGIKGVISNIPYMMMNPLWNADPRITHVDAVDVIDWFKERNLPMMWFITPENPARHLSDILAEIGLEKANMIVPGMYLDLKTQDRSYFEKLAKSWEVTTPASEDITEMVQLLSHAFEISPHPQITEGMTRFFSDFLNYGDATHVVVRVDGKLVGVASIVYSAGVGGFYNVAVHEDYRRQEMATSMMGKLLIDAIDSGYQYVILHSSERGKRVYEKIGFQTAFTYDRYLLRPQMVGFS